MQRYETFFTQPVFLSPCRGKVVSSNENNNIQSQMNNNKIFIVHGHDEAMKEAVARFIARLNIEPIILHEQANAGRTIIQKFLEEIENLTFAIVLYSPDDLGKAREEEKHSPTLLSSVCANLLGARRTDTTKRSRHISVPNISEALRQKDRQPFQLQRTIQRSRCIGKYHTLMAFYSASLIHHIHAAPIL